MKNITLLSVILLTIGSVSAEAQTPLHRAIHSQSPIAALKAKVARSMGKKAFTDIKLPSEQRIAIAHLSTLARLQKSDAEMDHWYKPQHQIEYSVNKETGEFEKAAEHTFTYTSDGEVATQCTNNGNVITKTTYTYDEHHNVITRLESKSTDGGATFTPTEKFDHTYDAVVWDLLTEKKSYVWSTDNTWNTSDDAFKRTITRDVNNNVTSVVVAEPYEGQLQDTKRITNTFDPTTKEANTYKCEEFDHNDDNTGFEWRTNETLKDIKWHATNGQLVSDYSEWMQYDNYMASATLYFDDENKNEILAGYITIDYLNDKNTSYQEVIDYSASSLGKDITTATYDDENGSLVYEHKYYDRVEEGGNLNENDVTEHEKTIFTYDDHGNLTSQARYVMFKSEGTELKQTAGTRYDYTYDEDKEAEKEMLVSTYDDKLGKYLPSSKTVTDAYVDIVTDGIGSVKNNVNNAPIEVYNLQGIRAKSATGKGVYIIRQGNVVKKIIK